ncbi:MAG TPA: glycosyltransferase [Sutterellaceae bacterium]|nr:glycosyltransferase [Sutterellaceae bacterium]
MSRKKVLFVVDSLKIGGIQRALINLLNTLSTVDQLELYLFCFKFNQVDKSLIPKNIKILPSSKLLHNINCSLGETLKSGPSCFILKTIAVIMCKIFGANFVYKLVFSTIKVPIKFDIAISYSNNLNYRSTYFGCNKFVLEKVLSKNKIAYLHVDYEKFGLDNRVNTEEYCKFDKIICVSHAVRSVFLKYLPYLESKTCVIYNIINPSQIIQKSRLSPKFKKTGSKCLKLVTVGRFDENKGIMKTIEVGRILRDKGISFEWNLIGTGVLFNQVQTSIEKLKLRSNLKVLGELENPYPYIASADLLVSLSITESFGLAIQEAIVLGTPVLALNYPALNEIVDNNKNAIILDQYDPLIIAQKILSLYYQPQLLTKLKKNCYSKILDKTSCEQILQLFKVSVS